MRKNFPVSGKEYRLHPDKSLISRTDLRGVITYANLAFVETSGFAEQELVGASHNIVRHPDMPPEAFADMWRSLKAGRAWTGMVKNRRKDGDHYWVQANATPIREDGRIVGYTSVRTAPSRAQVEAAEAAYALFRKDGARGLAIRDGEVVRTGPLGRLLALRHLGIGRRIGLTLGMLCATMLALAGLCLAGMAGSSASVDNLYRHRLATVGALDQIVRQLNRNDIALLEAIGSGDDAKLRDAARRVRDSLPGVERAWQSYRARADGPEELRQGAQFEQAYRRYLREGLEPVLSAAAGGDQLRALGLRETAMAPAFLPVRAGIDRLIGLQMAAAKRDAEAQADHYLFLRNGVVAALAAAVGLAVLAGIYLSRSIVRPMRQAVDVAKQIAACNLTAEIQPGAKDETGQMLHALNVMKLSLSNIVGGVRRNAEQVASNAAEIASGNMDLSARTEQQAANLEETAASMEQLTATVGNNAEGSESAARLVQDTNRTARAGGEAMDHVVESMDNITAGARRITDIIGVIDNIAFQTNLLALNAAVEAARAGEQGRGFAVVAGEVRALAQRSAAAAREIKELISDSVAQIEAGSSEVARARSTMDGIVRAVERVAGLMDDISLASREQRSGIVQVGQAVSQMDEATQQNAALVEQAAAASANLRQLGHELLQEVAVFKLERGAARDRADLAQRVIEERAIAA